MKKNQPKLKANLQKCTRNGVDGWRYGKDGHCFIGKDAKQRAFRAEAKRKADMWREKPKAEREEKKKPKK